MERLRTLLALLACLALAAGFTACGDDDDGGGEPVDENTSPETVLDRTFSTERQIESAVVDLAFGFDVQGTEESTFRAFAQGPIDSSGDGLPVFDLDLRVRADSPSRTLNLTAGATSTGESAFVNYKGTDYEVDPQSFQLLTGAFEASDEASENGEPEGLPGIRDYLTDVSNEGTEDIKGVETVHVSGAVDIDGLIKEIRPLAAGAGALGIGPAGVPSPQELDQLGRLVRSARFDVWAGAEDNLLRRFAVSLELNQPGGAGTANLGLDITLAEVNEPQEVEAPSDARPLSELLDEVGLEGLGFGPFGGIGDLGGGGGGSGGGGGEAPGPINPTLPPDVPQAPSPEAAEEYIQCLEEVVTAEDLERCQELLR